MLDAYVVKKGEDWINSIMDVYRMLAHNFIRSNFNISTSLGDFRSVLSHEGNFFFAQSPNFGAVSVGNVVVKKMLPWEI